MDKESLYQKKMAAQLQEWSAQINLLEAKINNASAGFKLHRNQEIQALRARQLAATEKMHELGHASGEAWKQVKLTADKLWDELREGLAAAQDKFK